MNLVKFSILTSGSFLKSYTNFAVARVNLLSALDSLGYFPTSSPCTSQILQSIRSMMSAFNRSVFFFLGSINVFGNFWKEGARQSVLQQSILFLKYLLAKCGQPIKSKKSSSRKISGYTNSPGGKTLLSLNALSTPPYTTIPCTTVNFCATFFFYLRMSFLSSFGFISEIGSFI